MIPYSRQTISADDVREVVKTLKSPFVTQGPKIAEFESSLRHYSGAKYAVAFSSGTAALHTAYFAAGIGKGNEVITTPLTFASTATMIIACGGKPVFADIDSRTGNLDTKEAERKINRKTKAIVAVDYAGLPCDIDALRRLARKHKLVFIEDAAHALGAEYHGKKVGASADMTMFSFHPVKSITTGEGGAILTNSREYYEKLMMFRSHGLTKDSSKLVLKTHASWHQEMQMFGFNYRLTDIQASLGISQMRKLDSFIKKRRLAAARYRRLLFDVPGLTLPAETRDRNSSYHLFAVRIASKKNNARDIIFEALRKAGIGVQVHYLLVYMHPFYKKLGYHRGLCPKAEAFSAAEISIPLFPTITLGEQKLVADELKKALSAVSASKGKVRA